MISDGLSGDVGGSQDRTGKKKGKKNAVSSEGHVNADNDGNMSTAEVLAALDDGEERTAMDSVRTIHDKLGQFGIVRTLYFAQRKGIDVTRRMAQTVVRNCEICRTIDPPAEK